MTKKLVKTLLAIGLVFNLLPSQIFADEGSEVNEPVSQEVLGAEEGMKEEVEVVKPEKIKITLTFTGIYNTNGTTKTSSQSNTISRKVSWKVLAAKFNNQVTYKDFSNQGVKYHFTGQWAYEDGSIVTIPLEFKYDNFSEDTNIIVHPIYDIIEPARLNFYKVDNISTASGSWSNTAGTFGTYTCTFKQPEAQPHYQFRYWRDAETGLTYNAGEKMSVTEASIGSGNTKDVYVYAVYQPSITVNYYDINGQLISSNEVYEAYEPYSFNAPEVNGCQFLGWSESANGSIISSSTRYELPALTSDRVQQDIHDMYAVYSTSYSVEHYIEDLDGNYILKDMENFEDVLVNTSVKAGEKAYEGFTLNSSSITEGNATAGLVLKLYYDRNSYSVNYEYENAPENAPALPEAATYRFGSDVKIAEAMQIEGYTFSGWDKEDFQMPAEDVTIRGSYQINTYKITWLNEDGSILEEDLDVEYGTLPSYDGEAPVKDADDRFTYEFDGWNEEIAAVTQDMTYTASFKATAIPVAVEEPTPVIEEPVIEEPIVIDEPVVEEPVIDEPVIEEPVIEEPIVEEPVIEEPIVEEPIVEEPVIEEPIIEEPVIEEPIVEEPIIKEEIREPVVPQVTPNPAPVEEPVIQYEAPVVEVVDQPIVVEYEEPVQEELNEVMVETVEEIAVPLTERNTNGWALINLLSAVFTALIAVVMSISFIRNRNEKDEDEEKDEEYRTNSKAKLFTIIPAIMAVIGFILTEDMRAQMVLTDKWTLVMLVILAVNAVAAYMARSKDKDEDNDEEQENRELELNQI